MKDKLLIMPLGRAVYCVACHSISNATGERCPGCAGEGSLVCLAKLISVVRVVPISRERKEAFVLPLEVVKSTPR